ncbi:MAG: XrtN system VIT domain-containing protein [Bacteroidales bacterium]|nr:XrtN system VIT domain-containing protein [Bacteroidales bacterium]
MENTRKKSHKNLFNAGIVLIVAELLILLFTSKDRSVSPNIFDDNGIFFINYVLTLIYLINVFIFHGTVFRFKRIHYSFFLIILTLLSISAFTLNNTMVLFARFSPWVSYYLILFYIAFLGLSYIKEMPGFLRWLDFFILGMGMVLVLYFTIYLFPLYHIAFLGAIFLGISLHIIVPLCVLIAGIVLFLKLQQSRIDRAFFLAGIVVPLIITAVFLTRWNTLREEIHEASASIITRPDNSLPEWVLFCQNMPSDEFSQKIIKGEIVYDVFKNLWNGRWGSAGFDEVKRHDPLVNIGIAINGDIDIDNQTRVKILKSQYNARHMTQRKLWTGKDLETVDVLNNVKIFPDYRMAYMEKIITIKNMNSWNNSQQEAAFTFYMPEGSVATSLSLWINGKEEKSRLSTKEKADSAYRSIVGVERRDPALLHWQEGNTVTVTVFPVTPEKNRKFKIGVSIPLEKSGDKLKMKTVYFDGPDTDNIMETSRVEIESKCEVSSIALPGGFESKAKDVFLYTGDFRPYWEVEMRATPLAEESFSFNNKKYRIKEFKEHKIPVNINKIYLDINESWTLDEFETILKQNKDLKVFVHHDQMIEISAENKDDVFKELKSKNFSLFPFYKIKSGNETLVISKSGELSPNLSDLEGSEFLNNLTSQLARENKRFNLFQIGSLSSPYLKSLKEFQVFNFATGSVNDINKLIQEQVFHKSSDDPSQIDLANAGISIIRDTMSLKTHTAPDHLLRLFAYNRIMKATGRNYFNENKEYIDEVLSVANEAYVVSPVSSLVVLESKKDYERFDIGENKNSLKNASMQSSGAVPEPSEWILISVFTLLVLLLFFRKRFFG